MTVAIVDYGSGNLRSAAKAFERAAHETGISERVLVTADPREVEKADRIVLPGVGAFADCRAGLYGVPGMVDVLQRHLVRNQQSLGIRAGEIGTDLVEGSGGVFPAVQHLVEDPERREVTEQDLDVDAVVIHRGQPLHRVAVARMLRGLVSVRLEA